MRAHHPLGPGPCLRLQPVPPSPFYFFVLSARACSSEITVTSSSPPPLVSLRGILIHISILLQIKCRAVQSNVVSRGDISHQAVACASGRVYSLTQFRERLGEKERAPCSNMLNLGCSKESADIASCHALSPTAVVHFHGLSADFENARTQDVLIRNNREVRQSQLDTLLGQTPMHIGQGLGCLTQLAIFFLDLPFASLAQRLDSIALLSGSEEGVVSLPQCRS